MISIRDIINSIFDPRSTGMIIMDYIETPKEEYKKRFDLVIKDMKEKTDEYITKHTYESDCGCGRYSCNINIRVILNDIFGLKELRYTYGEMMKLGVEVSNLYSAEEGYYFLLKNSLSGHEGRRMLDKLLMGYSTVHPFILKHFTTVYNITKLVELELKMMNAIRKRLH